MSKADKIDKAAIAADKAPSIGVVAAVSRQIQQASIVNSTYRFNVLVLDIARIPKFPKVANKKTLLVFMAELKIYLLLSDDLLHIWESNGFHPPFLLTKMSQDASSARDDPVENLESRLLAAELNTPAGSIGTSNSSTRPAEND